MDDSGRQCRVACPLHCSTVRLRCLYAIGSVAREPAKPCQAASTDPDPSRLRLGECPLRAAELHRHGGMEQGKGMGIRLGRIYALRRMKATAAGTCYSYCVNCHDLRLELHSGLFDDRCVRRLQSTSCPGIHAQEAHIRWA